MTNALGKIITSIRALFSPREVADKCGCDVTISHGGQHDIVRHLKTKKHLSVSCAVKQTSTLGAYFSKDNDYSVTRAEVGFTTFLIEHSIPFSVANHATKLFHKIFPDSAIAKTYACSRTKTSRLVEILV
jgi:hypothetical protein